MEKVKQENVPCARQKSCTPEPDLYNIFETRLKKPFSLEPQNFKVLKINSICKINSKDIREDQHSDTVDALVRGMLKPTHTFRRA